MERLTLLILFLIYGIKGCSTQSLPCRTASGDNCTSSICPNTVVTYTCTITSGTAAGITDWTLPSGACPSSSFRDKIRLSQLVSGLCVPQGNSTCGPYTASSGPTSDATFCLSSTLTVNITAAMNGGTVTCNNTNLFNTAITTVVSLETISVVGPPGAPNVMAKTIGPDMVLVVVNPSSSGGLPTSYNVTISNSSYVYTKSTPAFLNGSAMVTFTGLTNTTTYTISAVAINCAGSSNPATTILVSWPASTTSLPTSSGTNTPSPTTAPTLPLTEDRNIGIIIGVVIAVVVLVVLIIISIGICVFLCKPSNGSKPNKMDGQDGQPLAQVKVELSEEPVPARPPRQVPAEESHGKTQANRVPIEEALYDGNVGPGGMVTTGRGGYTQEAQYSTPDVSKKNADKQMYAEVQVSTAPKNTASSSKKGKGVLPPHSTQEGVFYSTVKT